MDPSDRDYFSNLVVDWESAATLPPELGVRNVFIRPGVVLGRNGGMIQQIFPSFFLGGTFELYIITGCGTQIAHPILLHGVFFSNCCVFFENAPKTKLLYILPTNMIFIWLRVGIIDICSYMFFTGMGNYGKFQNLHFLKLFSF